MIFRIWISLLAVAALVIAMAFVTVPRARADVTVGWLLTHPQQFAAAQAWCADKDPMAKSYRCSVVAGAKQKSSAMLLYSKTLPRRSP